VNVLEPDAFSNTQPILNKPQGRPGPPEAWQLLGGPVRPASRWAATSNFEEGQLTYSTNRRRVGRKRKEGSEGHNHKEEREGGSGMGEGH